MAVLHRTGYRGLAGLALLMLPLLTAGCGTDPVQPPTPAHATVGVGSDAPVPAAGSRTLSIVVTAEGGGPATGVVVSWSIVSGGGTLSSATGAATGQILAQTPGPGASSTGTSTTDGEGRAQITWTSDGAAGDVEVRAQIPGMSPLTISFLVTPGPATQLSLSPAAVEFHTVGQELAVTVDLMDEFGNTLDFYIQLSTDDTSVASVSQDGVLRAEGNGETTVRASFDGFEAQATVLVDFIAARLEASPETLLLTAIGERAEPTILAFDAEGNPFSPDVAGVQWFSTDDRIASVSSGGEITATGIGTTTVSAHFQGVSAEIPVMVAPEVAELRITPSTLALSSIGAKEGLEVTARDRNGHEIEVPVRSWGTSDEAVATVDEDGTVTAGGNGKAEISVSVDGVSTSIQVTVQQVTARIALSPHQVSFTGLGSTRAVSVGAFDALGTLIEGISSSDVAWSSSDEAIFTVSDLGLLTSVSVGSAQLAVIVDGIQTSAAITVNQLVHEVTLSPASISFSETVGEEQTITATALDSGGSTIPTHPDSFTWTSSAPDVVTVSVNGVVTILANGSATITADLGGVEGIVLVEANIPGFSITVTTGGDGSGTVTSDPGGIDCGSTCSGDFLHGSTVTLMAVAGTDSEFAGWSGAGCSGTDACVIEVTEASSVTATFDEVDPTWPLIATLFPTDPNATFNSELRTQGFELTVDNTIEVTALRGFFSGTQTVWIYNVTEEVVVASAEVSSNNTSWGSATLDSPVTLLPGRTYAVAVTMTNGRARTGANLPTGFQGVTVLRSCHVAGAGDSPCAAGASTSVTLLYGGVDLLFRLAPPPGP